MNACRLRRDCGGDSGDCSGQVEQSWTQRNGATRRSQVSLTSGCLPLDGSLGTPEWDERLMQLAAGDSHSAWNRW